MPEAPAAGAAVEPDPQPHGLADGKPERHATGASELHSTQMADTRPARIDHQQRTFLGGGELPVVARDRPHLYSARTREAVHDRRTRDAAEVLEGKHDRWIRIARVARL